MTLSVTSPPTWTAQDATSVNRSHRSRHGGTEFDQQLQTPQAPQSAQSTSPSAGSPLSAAASLSADLLRTIAAHVGSALSFTPTSN